MSASMSTQIGQNLVTLLLLQSVVGHVVECKEGEIFSQSDQTRLDSVDTVEYLCLCNPKLIMSIFCYVKPMLDHYC